MTLSSPARRPLGKRALATAVAVALAASAFPYAALAQNNVPPAARANAGRASTETVTLNFVGADLESAVRAVGQYLKKDILIDPRVKGSVTLSTDGPVTRSEAWRQLQAILRFQGFAVVETEDFIKVVPDADARFQGGPAEVSGSATARGDQVVTQIFRLNYESANNLVTMLRPLVSANNPITANPSNNTLVITDAADNLRRVARIIAAVDVPAGGEAEVIPLKNSLAVDLAALLTRLLEPAAGGGADPGQRMTVLAEPRTNSILLRAASTARVAFAKTLIAKLDGPNAQNGNIHVVYLKNAEAAKLAQTLRGVITGTSSSSDTSGSSGFSTPNASMAQSSANGTSPTAQPGATGQQGSPVSSANANPFSSGGGSSGGIQADPATNALIITASEPVYRNLRNIIEQLDVRRAQIFVESLIVEVTSDKAAEFGIQWQSLGGVGGSGTSVFGGTNFGSTGTNILTTSANLASVGTGLNIGVINGSVTIPGVGTITNLGFLARALESNSNTNILSTPNILTLDNEEAKIVIGQNVPFITGSYTSSAGSSSTPFQTVERHDVGLTLRIKPQVSDSGTVKMALYQEVSSVADTTISGNVVTNKRSIESNVLVEDGQIIVIGGLVQDSVSGTLSKVPVLGDLPYVGGLFRYDSRKRSKTNLMVFLRPYIIRTANGNDSITQNKYEMMRSEGKTGESGKSLILPDMPVPELPPIAAPGYAPGQGRKSPLAPEASSGSEVLTNVPSK